MSEGSSQISCSITRSFLTHFFDSFLKINIYNWQVDLEKVPIEMITHSKTFFFHTESPREITFSSLVQKFFPKQEAFTNAELPTEWT